MNGQIGWTDLFWSAAGRLARTPFLLASAALILLAAIYEAAVGPTLHWLSGWFVYPALIWSRRLRPLQASARPRPLGLVGGAGAVRLRGRVVRPLRRQQRRVHPGPDLGRVELGVMQGEDGANRFGPSPMAMAA